MTFRIKINFDDYGCELMSLALSAGGEVLNGAKDINGGGVYIAPSPGMDFCLGAFILSDQWFNGASQDINTVRNAVEQATGIKLGFASQMLSSEPATISSYKVVNSEIYNITVGKQMALRMPPTMSPGAK